MDAETKENCSMSVCSKRLVVAASLGILFCVVVISVVIWQLGLFTGPPMSTTSTGFERIKPILMGITVREGGDAEFIFINGAGGNITLENITFTDSMDPNTPRIVVNGGAGKNFGPEDQRNNGQGGNFPLLNPLPSKITPRDPYAINGSINYSIVQGGEKITRTEGGTIRGLVE
jgi:hypothetical protein